MVGAEAVAVVSVRVDGTSTARTVTTVADTSPVGTGGSCTAVVTTCFALATTFAAPAVTDESEGNMIDFDTEVTRFVCLVDWLISMVVPMIMPIDLRHNL